MFYWHIMFFPVNGKVIIAGGQDNLILDTAFLQKKIDFRILGLQPYRVDLIKFSSVFDNITNS